MDFDLFELEDDDILSSVCVIPAVEEEIINNPLPGFNCSGEDGLSSQFSVDSFIKNYYIFKQNVDITSSIKISPYNFNSETTASRLVSNYLVGKTRMHIQMLTIGQKGQIFDDGPSFYERRREVTLLYHLIYMSKTPIPWSRIEKNLQSLRSLITCLSSAKSLKDIYLANSIKGNETDSAAYHLLHGFLEWKLLDLTILNKYELEITNELEKKNTTPKATFVTQFEKFLDDLIIMSACLFKKKRLIDLITDSAFPCTCIKECWLVLQLLIEKNGNGLSFWKYFNSCIEKVKSNPEDNFLTSENHSEFIIWLLKSVTKLQGYRMNGIYEGPCHVRVVENFYLLEMTVDTFLSGNPSEEQIRIVLCVLAPIILEWWTPKIGITMSLWEYFHKKLNSSFFIAGSAPGSLAIASSSGKGYLDKMKSLLETGILDSNQSSYTLFTLILGKTIDRLNKTRQSNQTQKILGRIYSKFSPSKFLALNETGIHHLIELFLALALSVDLKTIASKLKDNLLSICLEKIAPNRQICIAKGHVALLILFSEEMLDISDYVTKLLEQLSTIKNDLAVSKVITEGLSDIFKVSNSRGENLLIDNWLSNFLNSCTYVEQERTLEIIHTIFERIGGNNSFIPNSDPNRAQPLLKALSTHILPFIKQNFINSFSNWIPILAADFCIYTTGNDQGQFQKLFKFFLQANSANKQAMSKFLLGILLSEKESWVDPCSIIQVWLKSLVILSANNEDVTRLTKIVCNLDDFRFVCNLPVEDFLAAKEPLCVFVSTVGKTFDECQNFGKKCLISDKFNSYLTSFDKWLSDKNEKTEVTFRFYSFIAIVIFNCPNIVYIRSKISCFFHIAMTRFIIPCAVQVGKEPEVKFIQIIHKVWPVLIQGIGKLNFMSDPYITKTLIDLIVKWTPHFRTLKQPKVVARPFINCLTNDNEQLSLFVFDKLTSVFLAMQRRQSDPHACLVIAIFQEVVNAVCNNESKIITLVKAAGLTIIEHLMMVDEIVPSRNMLLELLRKIIYSSAFSESSAISDLMIEHLKVITVKHLSYFTFFYFELLTQIANINYKLVEDIMEFLQEQIKVVEDKRGGGTDNRLRSCIEKLKGVILAAKSKQ